MRPCLWPDGTIVKAFQHKGQNISNSSGVLKVSGVATDVFVAAA
jgi:hypothetical protein